MPFCKVDMISHAGKTYDREVQPGSSRQIHKFTRTGGTAVAGGDTFSRPGHGLRINQTVLIAVFWPGQAFVLLAHGPPEHTINF